MKYLFLIIRHVFPRKRWVLVKETNLTNSRGGVIGKHRMLRDQFGNVKDSVFEL